MFSLNMDFVVSDIAVIGYGVAAAAFAILTILLLTAWGGRKEGGFFLLATFVSCVWASTCVYQAWTGDTNFLVMVSVELLRDISWLIFLLIITARIKNQTSSGSFLQIVITLSQVLAILIVIIALYVVIGEKEIPELIGFDLGVILFLGLNLLGMILVEQIFRNTAPNARWAIKYLCFGLGGVFVYDFYLFSDALLFKGLDEGLWSARGYVNLLIVPLLAVAAVRNQQWSLDVYVSRSFVFHSASITGAGIYLVGMALGGYYIKYIGGDWGYLAQLTFLFAAILLLISLFFSENLRAKLRVFLSKHFFNYRFDYREEWSRLINTLSSATSDSNIRKTVISAMAKIIESPGGGLWLVSRQRDIECAETLNMYDERVQDSEDNASLLAFLTQRKWIIDLNEYKNDPARYSNLELPRWLNDTGDAFLIVPLLSIPRDANQESNADRSFSDDESLIGFILLTRPRVNIQINWEVRDLLLMAGRQCAYYLELLKMNEELIDARQFDAFNRLSAYVVHDLKNIVAQLSLVVSNGKKYKDNPEFIDDAFATVENANEKMSRMLSQLKKGRMDSVESSDCPVNSVNLKKLLETVVHDHRLKSPKPTLVVTDDEVMPVLAEKDRLAAIIGHLIQNAQEATPENGEVSVSLCATSPGAEIKISDTGCGMSSDFIRYQLFKPFVTTKGNAGMGIGVYESKEFINSLGGKLLVDSTEGVGSTFTIRLKGIA